MQVVGHEPNHDSPLILPVCAPPAASGGNSTRSRTLWRGPSPRTPRGGAQLQPAGNGLAGRFRPPAATSSPSAPSGSGGEDCRSGCTRAVGPPDGSERPGTDQDPHPGGPARAGMNRGGRAAGSRRTLACKNQKVNRPPACTYLSGCTNCLYVLVWSTCFSDSRGRKSTCFSDSRGRKSLHVSPMENSLNHSGLWTTTAAALRGRRSRVCADRC